jgi:hypothetical protein
MFPADDEAVRRIGALPLLCWCVAARTLKRVDSIRSWPVWRAIIEFQLVPNV